MTKKYDIVPLYYNMKKALPTQLTKESIYDGLIAAFKWGNIGIYSNSISKIWNNDVFIKGTDEKKEMAINVIKLLCMENNYNIDAAKTLYMPTRPDWFQEKLTEYSNSKLPAFFEYAKDKNKKQVSPRNGSFVNKIYQRVTDKPISAKKLGLGKIDYRLMMKNPDIVCAKEVAELYDRLNKQYKYMLSMKDEYVDNLRYVACQLRSEFEATGYSAEMVANMLVEYLYGRDKRYKQVLWFCYGQYIVNNLKLNLTIPKMRTFQCKRCGEWFETYAHATKTMCDACAKLSLKESHRKYNKKRTK